MGLVLSSVDNWAHAGGFAGGYFLGKWLDPRQRERTDHIAVALVCLAASLLAVIASVVHYAFMPR
jgi:hypothetical protein